MGPDPVTQLRPQWRHRILLGALLAAEGSFLLGFHLQALVGWSSCGGTCRCLCWVLACSCRICRVLGTTASAGGVWLLPLVTPDRECARRGRAEGPRGVAGHRHKLLQTARNQETLKTPESFPARAQFCLVLVPKNKLEEGELGLEHRARCQSLCHRGQCPGCAPSQLCPVGLRAGWCCRVLQDILGFYYFSNPSRFTTWARRAAPAPV